MRYGQPRYAAQFEPFGQDRDRRPRLRFRYAWAAPGRTMESSEPDRGESRERLVDRIHCDAQRLQSGNPEQRLCLFLPEHDGSPGGLSHERYLSAGHVQPDFAAISQAEPALSSGSQADGLQVLPRDQAVGRPGVNQEEPFPDPFKLGWVPYGYGYVRRSHFTPLFQCRRASAYEQFPRNLQPNTAYGRCLAIRCYPRLKTETALEGGLGPTVESVGEVPRAPREVTTTSCRYLRYPN